MKNVPTDVAVEMASFHFHFDGLIRKNFCVDLFCWRQLPDLRHETPEALRVFACYESGIHANLNSPLARYLKPLEGLGQT